MSYGTSDSETHIAQKTPSYNFSSNKKQLLKDIRLRKCSSLAQQQIQHNTAKEQLKASQEKPKRIISSDKPKLSPLSKQIRKLLRDNVEAEIEHEKLCKILEKKISVKIRPSRTKQYIHSAQVRETYAKLDSAISSDPDTDNPEKKRTLSQLRDAKANKLMEVAQWVRSVEKAMKYKPHSLPFSTQSFMQAHLSK